MTTATAGQKKRQAELAARLLLRLADHGLVLKVHGGTRCYVVGRSVNGTWPMGVDHHATTLTDIWAWLDDQEKRE